MQRGKKVRLAKQNGVFTRVVLACFLLAGMFLVINVPIAHAAISCKQDSAGVTHCYDSKTWKRWTIHPSPSGTRIG